MRSFFVPFARRRRIRFQKAFVGLCVSGGALIVEGGPCHALPVARLRAVRPVVETQKTKKSWKVSHDRTTIVFGDRVRTGAHGSAQVVFNDSSILYIKSGTQVRIEEPKSASEPLIVSVFGALGEVFLDAKGPIKVRTAAATAAVRSTAFSLRPNGENQFSVRLNGENQSVLTVKEGFADFYNDEGRVQVEASEQSSAIVGRGPTAPVRVDVSGLLSWTGEMSGLPLPFEFPPDAGVAVNAPLPDGVGAALNGAKAQLQSGDARGAQIAFRALLDSTRGDEARAGLALALLSGGQRAEARAAVDGATTPFAGGVRALLLLEEGDALAAQNILEPIAGPQNAPFQLVSLLALAQIQGGDLAGAQLAAGRAVNMAPQSAGARATLALAQFFRRQDKEAGRSARLAVELDPFSPLALLALGRIEAAQGNLDEARQALEQAVGFEPQLPGGQRDLGAIEAALGRWTRAERAYRAALVQRPDDARALAGLGTVLGRNDERTEAKTNLTRAVELAPDDPLVRAQLVSFLVENGELVSASREGERLLGRRAPSTSSGAASRETAGDDDPALGALFIGLSEAYLFRQKLNEALDYATRAVRLLPDSSPAQYQLGRVFLEQGRTTQAQSRFQLATILDPNSPRARYGLGFTQELVAQGDDIARPLGQIQAAREGAPSVALSLQNQASPGASERLQAALQDPTSVRTASRSFGDWQLSGNLGSDSEATGEVSYSHANSRTLTSFGLRRDTTQGVRAGNDSSQSQVAFSFGRKAKNSQSSIFAFGSFERVNPITDGDFDQPAQIFPSTRERPVVIVGANIAQGQSNRTRMFLQVDRNSGDSIFSAGPINSQYRSIHGEVRHDRRLSDQWSLNIGGSWGQRRYDIASLVDFSSAGTSSQLFSNVNLDSHNALGYARVAFVPSPTLKLEGEMKVSSNNTHLFSNYYLDPADPLYPPSSQESSQDHAQLLPSFIATYRSGKSTLLRFRARRLLGALNDFELLSPTDLFGFNSDDDVPQVSFGGRGQSYEFEVNHTFSNSSFLRLGLFRVEEGLSLRSDTGEQFNFSRVQGARIGYEGLLNRNTSFFTLATWNGSRAQTQNPFGGNFSPSTLSGLPDYSAEVGVQYLGDNGFFVQPSLGYIGPRYRARFDGKNARDLLGGFPLCNLRIGKRFGLNRSFYIEGSNLFDRSYTLASAGYQRLQAGRQLRIGATFRF